MTTSHHILKKLNVRRGCIILSLPIKKSDGTEWFAVTGLVVVVVVVVVVCSPHKSPRCGV